MEKAVEITVLVILIIGIVLGKGDADFNLDNIASGGFFTSNQAYSVPGESIDYENSYAVDGYSDPKTGNALYDSDSETYMQYDDLDMGYEFYKSDYNRYMR
jgi:hypothetical protein